MICAQDFSLCAKADLSYEDQPNFGLWDGVIGKVCQSFIEMIFLEMFDNAIYSFSVTIQ